MALFDRKKPLEPRRELRKKLYIQLMKKPHKLDEKTWKKTRNSINEKSLNLIKKQEGKPIISTLFCRG